MSSTSSGLLAQIEADVLDGGVPISTLLQKIIVLGGKAKSEKMREWARHELNGYIGSDAPLPAYRRIHAALYIRITNRAGYNAISQRINPSDLPDFMTKDVDLEEAVLGSGIGELEALAGKGDRTDEPHWLSPAWADVVVDYLNKAAVQDGVSVVQGAYWELPNSSIKGLLVRVRTALAELVAELATLTPQEQEVPTKIAADQAVQLVITGERPTINITNQHTDTGPNISTQAAHSATVAAGQSTAIGNQTASGENSTVIGAQAANGDSATVNGRDSAASSPVANEHEGWWIRLRKRGALVAFFTIVGGIAGIVGAIAAVLTLLGWTPW
ncbi:AbiTii domain-containing protein [Amycolatopsis sp. NPDC004772]